MPRSRGSSGSRLPPQDRLCTAKGNREAHAPRRCLPPPSLAPYRSPVLCTLFLSPRGQTLRTASAPGAWRHGKVCLPPKNGFCVAEGHATATKGTSGRQHGRTLTGPAKEACSLSIPPIKRGFTAAGSLQKTPALPRNAPGSTTGGGTPPPVVSGSPVKRPDLSGPGDRKSASKRKSAAGE